ncbi:hypothetical protein [Lentiprolixibacter aurantiacus]|uniref:Uncharacterized protein n=1 Tax=Lentiprolixibacter aurantiacus TaxID=2993939 RepID=A0AAE3MJW2_9FLAO|nr:hypothetical protein [Lentiprolixibacter aurantiacus]MCX2718477.1 hypothetical protein [Lentiprolixibacter aurantiacus]
MKPDRLIPVLILTAFALLIVGCDKEDVIELQSFRVSDIATGAPISDVELMFARGASTCCGESFAVEGYETFLTDGNGLVRLPTEKSRGYDILISKNGYYGLDRTNYGGGTITNYISDLDYYERSYDGRETELALFPEADVTFKLLANSNEIDMESVVLRMCYIKQQSRFCFPQDRNLEKLLNGNFPLNSLGGYEPGYVGSVYPTNKDTTIVFQGIGDLPMQLDLIYLDQDNNIIRTQDSGVYLTPRNTVTEIVIELN